MVEILAASPLFDQIEDREITSLLHCLGAAERTFRKGEIILSEGTVTDRLGIVLSGRVLMEHSDLWGENTVLGTASAGASFAESYACLPQKPLLITVTAAEDCRILFLQAERILTTCPSTCPFHSRLVRNLLTLSASKCLALSQRILHTSSKTIRGRLLSYLSDQAINHPDRFFTIPYNRQQLANYLSVERSALSKELSKMQKDGLIRYHRNEFQLLIDGQ